jgi:hypothetical protein
MSNFDPNSNANLINLMNDEVARINLRVVADISMCEKYISKLETVNNKIKVKDTNEDNIIESFVSQQIEWRKKDLDVFKTRLEIITIMTEILNNYEYGFLELINQLQESPSEESN